MSETCQPTLQTNTNVFFYCPRISRQPDRVTLNRKNGLRAETKYVPITADRKVNEGLAALVHEASESNGYPFNDDGHTDLLKY